MKEGDEVNFLHEGLAKKGRIIKMFTQIGFNEHGQKFVVIAIDGVRGLFNKKSTVVIKQSDLELV